MVSANTNQAMTVSTNPDTVMLWQGAILEISQKRMVP